MTNDDKDLLPCPFCGATKYLKITYQDSKANASIQGDQKYWGVFCMEGCCASIDSVYPTREEAIKAWNTRSTPQHPSEPLKELDEDELFAIISKHNTNNPDRFYNPKEMTNDRQLAIDICERFGQPSEKKALSVDSIKALLTTIMKKELVDIGEHFCFVCGEPMSEEKRGLLINHIAQAIHSALPARKEVKWPEKMEHGCDPNGYCDCSASDANEMRDACIAAYEEAIPAQREVRYPEKEYCGKINTALHNDNCEECKYHKLRNKLIDKMKKLNS